VPGKTAGASSPLHGMIFLACAMSVACGEPVVGPSDSGSVAADAGSADSLVGADVHGTDLQGGPDRAAGVDSGGRDAGGSPDLAGPGCQGVSLRQSGVLDLDLATVRVSGRVTLGGATLPNENTDRGSLRFVESHTGASVQTPLGSSGDVSYELRLAPGRYDVSLVANDYLCSYSTLPQVPCVSGPLLNDVALDTDGVLDVNIPSIQVQGAVSLNGADMPGENTDRGQLLFSLAGGGSLRSQSFGSSGAVSYGLTLLPGSYDVSLVANDYLCSYSVLPQVPCNSGPLLTGQNLQQSGVLDMDIPSVQVQGAVTLNGADMPAENTSRGQLRFSLVGGGGVLSQDFGSAGAVSYGLTLLPGTYEVGLVANDYLCSYSTLPQVPCVSGVLLGTQSLQQSGVLDINIPAIQVQGTVSLNGAGMPDENTDRGQLLFTLAGGGGVLCQSFGSSGAVDYGLTLLPGIYDVSLVANDYLCSYSTLPQVPCNSGPLLVAQGLHASGVLDLDIPSIQVQGAVSLNGADMPAENTSRGALSFSMAGGGGLLSQDFGASSAVSYGVTLLPGAYDVDLAANDYLCSYSTLPQVPCVSGPLLRGQPLQQTGVLDVDIPSVQVQGSVSLEGATMPDENSDRGHRQLRRHPAARRLRRPALGQRLPV